MCTLPPNSSTRIGFRRLTASLLVAVAGLILLLYVPSAAAQASVQGQWQTLPNLMPINPVHAALLHNGKVLIVSGSGNLPSNTNLQAAIFDPATGTTTPQPVAWDMFCNGMVVLEDGRAIVTGGTLQYDPFHGQSRTAVYDPATGQFTDVQAMAHGRWYPTVTNLSDGTVMTYSGLDENGNTNNTIEIYTIGSGWSTPFGSPFAPPLYPRMHLLPNGQVFYSGSTTSSRYFDPVAHTWSGVVATTNYSGTRTYGTSVLLPLTPANGYKPVVMIMGGGDPATNTTEIIDLSAATPKWVFGPNMSQPRIEMNATILPNGKVVVLGGSLNDEDTTTASLNADLYDPASNTFSSAGQNAFARLYHSNSLLLPDATVLFIGGNPSRGTYEQHNEIYSPAYLFNADGSPATRPTITGVPSTPIGYRAAFQVQTPNAANIASVVLMRPGAPTHAFDMEQRLVGLSFAAGNGVLNVTSPPNNNIAPPGYYMLFLLNAAGVPSVAQFIQLSPGAGDVPPTGVISSPATNLTITTGQSVFFDGSASSDPDGTISAYSWTFPGGTPSSSSLATPGSVTYNSVGSFTAALTVTDNANLTDPNPPTRTITVNPVSGVSTPTLVQHASKDAGTTNSSSMAFPGNNIAGNWIAVIIRAGKSGQVFTVSDSLHNTYHAAVQFNQTLDTPNGETLAIYYAEKIAGGANTVTVSDSISNNTLRFAILEYSGVAASNSLDVTAAAQGSGTTLSSGSATTTANGDLILGLVATADGVTFTAGPGFAIEESVPVPPSKLIAEDTIQAAAGPVAASATLSTFDIGGALMAAFKAAFASGPPPASITATAGSAQSATVNTAFATQLQATVKDASNNPVSGVVVTFTAPASGASGTFAGGVDTATTNASGVATAPVFTANSTAGGPYTVAASVSGVATPANFSLTNLAPPPSITSLNPTSGPVGTSVTITGTNFGASQGTSTVTFNGTAATPTSWSATSIVVPAPGGATTGNVVVTVGALSSNGVLFTVVVPPSISSLSPNVGSVGTPVTISGTNFGPTQGSSTVTFNGTLATPTSWNGTTILVTVPVGANTGNVVVTVNGLSSSGVAFTVNPISVSVSPATVTLATGGGQQIFSDTVQNDSSGNGVTWSLSGAGCSGAACGTIQPFNAGTGEVYNAPAIAPNPPTVTLTATSVTDPTKSASATITINQTTPNISSLSPASGPAGTTVSITGTNFGLSVGTSTVTLNGTAASPTNWSSTAITFIVPSGATTGNVVITVGGFPSNGVPFTVTNQPNITGISPASGPVGTSVTITGTNFGASQGTSTVTFSGVAGTPVSWSATSIVVPVPAGVAAGSSPVIVTVGGVASSQSAFVVTPRITSLNPSSGPIGTSVTISGSNFGAAQGSSTVTFNGTSASPTAWSDTSIVVPVPPGATTGSLVVTVGPGSISSASVLFTVTATITNLFPNSGLAGTNITISGINFGATQGTSTVTFNGVPSTAISWSNTSIFVPVPPSASTGNVVVTVGGIASNGVLFTVPPNITSLSPTSAPVGNSVTITGTNFGASQGTSTVTFNGTAATPTSWSNASIVVLVPTGATTGNVVVTVGGLASNGVSFMVPATIAATAGTPQSATVNTAFATQLQATVKDAGNNPVSGVVVTFTAPASGASGTFAGGVNTATTNASGVATSATFTANSTAGGPYTVTGAVAGVATPANFSLTNTAATAPTITLVQHASKDAGTTNSSSLAFPGNNSVGNWIAVIIRAGKSGQVFTVSDSLHNTYHVAVQFNQTLDAPNGETLAIYYAENIAGGANTVTVSDSISNNTLRFAILEYSGVATSNSLDVTAAAQGSGTTLSSGSATTTASGDLILGLVATADAMTFTAGPGFTIEERAPSPPSTKVIAEDAIQTLAGPIAVSASLSASDNGGALLAAFKHR